MDNNEDLLKKLEHLTEMVRRYMSSSESHPASTLFLAGVQSALETMARSIHKQTTEMERAIFILGEMRAMIGETNAGIRIMRNRVFCMAGESEQMAMERKISKEEIERKPCLEK